MRRPYVLFRLHALCATSLCAYLVLTCDAQAQVGIGNGFIARGVGGVSIDANGALAAAELDELHRLADLRRKVMQAVPADLQQPNELRKVSLRGLEEALTRALASDKHLPDELGVLAGLQRIRYVFVYPEQNDIVLVGYGEGWKIDDRGNLVGINTGLPVLLLEDLVVALRTADQAARGGIYCSIDPTPEGINRLESYYKTVRAGADPRVVAKAFEEALGPQVITVGGVPDTTHFARVLVAADYKMKRLGMNFDKSPVAGMPSYLELIKRSSRGVQNLMPRWWLATHYEPLLTDEQGLAWELRGAGVKCLTEDEFIGPNGRRQRSGKASPAAQKWADTMTAKYDELCQKEPIFGELRNCMDLAVIAALISQHGLLQKADLRLPTLLGHAGLVSHFDPPKQVDTRASFVETRRDYIISASGGVMIDSWQASSQHERSDSLAPVRAEVDAGRGDHWRWN